MSYLSKRLAKRIFVESGFVVDECIRRYRPGRHMRATGCWSWSMKILNAGDGLLLIGSSSSATRCLNAKYLTIHNDKFVPLDFTIDTYDTPPPTARANPHIIIKSQQS